MVKIFLIEWVSVLCSGSRFEKLVQEVFEIYTLYIWTWLTYDLWVKIYGFQVFNLSVLSTSEIKYLLVFIIHSNSSNRSEIFIQTL